MRISELGRQPEVWGAHGVLKISKNIQYLSCANIFEPGIITPVTARFSFMTEDLETDYGCCGLIGFSLKFYTRDGTWDLVGSHLPVFFLRDPEKFSALVISQRRDPETKLRDMAAMWDFLSVSPESLHILTMLFSDRGLPASTMHMSGYGNHAYSLWQQSGERVWVKFHVKTEQGHRYCPDNHVARKTGYTHDFYRQALFTSIEAGAYPRWSFSLQTMTLDQAKQLEFDPFDVTKVWPQTKFPLTEVGTLELSRNACDHEEIEQLAFTPANLVSGIGHSPDRLLQSRVHSYPIPNSDRLGTQCGAPERNRSRGRSRNIAGNNIAFVASTHNTTHDDFSQPRSLYLSFSLGQKARLFSNVAASLKHVPTEIAVKQIGLFNEVHPEYGAGVCAAIDALDPQF
ncbi:MULTISPECIES: catalase [unclassified Rhizobium]|uniref:catalase n=1 Tax=unclassified Rhizobium TaxID=2613769 RepID=UPI0009EB3246|nr:MULTISPECIES: catalase [unclassified Rhizobium]